ncbi:MAG: sulfite exporter TauE/SafE family protein [Clostridia bacterium]|nr:sulfite exporter TauE/SafE family protein [Clostridia bacterium]
MSSRIRQNISGIIKLLHIIIPQKSHKYKDCGKFFKQRQKMMQIKIEKNAKKKFVFAIITGIAAGFLNGFLGAGSGVVLMFAIAALNPDKSEEASRDNFATVVACVLPLSVVSTAIYVSKDAASGELVGRFALPAAIGGIIGAFLTDRLNTKILRLAFAVVVIIAGVNMIR